jgi:hypothetical protein
MRPYVLATLVAVVGCGPPKADGGEVGDGTEAGDSTETGDDPDPDPFPALPDIDPEAWCGDVESPPLGVIDTSFINIEGVGPCGHVLSTTEGDDQEVLRLTHPDGASEVLLEHGHTWPTFDVTGQLVLLYEPLGGSVELRDLAAGTHRTFDLYTSSHGLGFVRSVDPEQPSMAFVRYHDGRLLAVTVDETTEQMTDSLSSQAVVGSLGNNKVLAARGAQLFVVDVDSGESLPTEIDDFYQGPAPGGETHWDGLAINYSGSLGVHKVIVQGPEFEDYAYSTIENRVIDIETGEVIAACDLGVSLVQAATEQAPSFVVCSGELMVWLGGELVHVDVAQPSDFALSDAGPLAFTQVVGEELEIVRISAENPTEVESIAIVQSGQLMISANGEAIVHIHPSETCADMLCSEYLHEYVQWTVDAGLGQPVLSAGRLRIDRLFDDGSLLAWGTLVEGPIDGPLPTPALLSIDADGQLDRQWAFEVDVNGHGDVHELADGRLFVSTRHPGNLWTIDLAGTGEPTLVLGSIDASYYLQLDGQRRRVVLGNEDGDVLHWGAI